MKKRYLILSLAILIGLTGCGQTEQIVKNPYSASYDVYNSNDKQNISELTDAANKELNTIKDDGKLHVFYNDNTYLVQYNSTEKITYDDQNSNFDSQNYKTEIFKTDSSSDNNSFYNVISTDKNADKIKFKSELDNTPLEVVTEDVDYQIAAD